MQTISKRQTRRGIQTNVQCSEIITIPIKIGKRTRAPLEAQGARKQVLPSHAVLQYGGLADARLSVCKAHVCNEDIEALVDTGSEMTLISQRFFDRIKKRLAQLKVPISMESSYQVKGILGKAEDTKGEITNLPVQLKKHGIIWNINASIVETTTADLLIGKNTLDIYESNVDFGKKTLKLTNKRSGKKGIIPLYRKKSTRRTVAIARYKPKRKRVQFEDQRKEIPTENMELDATETTMQCDQWPCERGIKERICLQYREAPDLPPTPCSKCAPAYYEELEFEDAKERYSLEKHSTHSGVHWNYKNNQGTRNEVEKGYNLYMKGSRLTPNGQICVGTIAIAYVGTSWDKFRKDRVPLDSRKRDPNYDQRSQDLQKYYVSTAESDERAIKALEEHRRKKKQKLEEEKLKENDPLNGKHWDNTISRFKRPDLWDHYDFYLKQNGIKINDEYWSWDEVRLWQAKFTWRPKGKARPYHYRGPHTQCWHHDALNSCFEQCDLCLANIEALHAIKNLPEAWLIQLEKEKKILPRQRLAPLLDTHATFPTPWQNRENVAFRRWTPSSKQPDSNYETPVGWILYSNRDDTVNGIKTLTTGIEVKFSHKTYGIIQPFRTEERWTMNNITLPNKLEKQVSLTEQSDRKVYVTVGAPLAILYLQSVGKTKGNQRWVAAGQKLETEPAVFEQDLTQYQQRQLEELLERNKDIFSDDLMSLGKSSLVKHTIQLHDKAVFPPKYYRHGHYMKRVIEDEIKILDEAKIIEKVNIDQVDQEKDPLYISPVVIVKKKNGENRFCVDYRALNRITIGYQHVFPEMDKLLSDLNMKGKKPVYFSALDLASGYWQVEMDPNSKNKTAFMCHLGVFRWNRMPFGLKNAPVSFQAMMD